MNASQDLKSNLNNTTYLIDTSFTASKDARKDRKSLKEDSVQIFLKDTEEINDIIITNGKGEVIYLYSKFETLDEEFLKSYKEDFK